MPLTPADVHNVAFKKPPIGKRGYDEDEVDAFLDEVERELARLIEENSDLKAQVERLQRAGGGGGAAPELVSDNERLTRENAELRAEVDRAQQQLRQAQSQMAQAAEVAKVAQAPTEQFVPPARDAEGEQALSVLMTAQRTANEHIADAKREAERLLSDARGKAEQLTREARSKAEALERDARQRHQEAMGSLEIKRAALQKHIEELKAFEREYRTRLKAYLEGQLRELDGRGQAIEHEVARSGAGPNSAGGSPGGGGYGIGSRTGPPDSNAGPAPGGSGLAR